jgi:hypothetical protein
MVAERLVAGRVPAVRAAALRMPAEPVPGRVGQPVLAAGPGGQVQHPAGPDHGGVGEHVAVAHVMAQVEVDDLGVPVAVAEVLLGDGPQAVTGPDRYELVEAHALPLRS